MTRKPLIYLLFCLFAPFSFYFMQAQTVVPLYDGEIPNSKPHSNDEISANNVDGIWIISKVSRPTLTIFLPSKTKMTGTAVIICPGGGYTNLAMGYEGEDVARRFVDSGIAAFVLKYRIPDDSIMIHKETGPLEDAQRALLLVRWKAREWGINPNRIGIMGFSAGGHLASTAGTHFNINYIHNPEHISLRPDFMILIYPVISFNRRIAHMGSSQNLIGAHPSPQKIKKFSSEEQVTDQTPPAFLVHAKNDDTVPYENSTEFADALRKHHIPVEVFLYEEGGHGFGMKNPTSNRSWMDLCIRWMYKEHFLPG